MILQDRYRLDTADNVLRVELGRIGRSGSFPMDAILEQRKAKVEAGIRVGWADRDMDLHVHFCILDYGLHAP